ncbi:MAG TPA: hypothetical protein VKM55_24365 [Candidatus Lokiarchaeia archaeon]|nr:hypothetical protein [Candidatus Lokiarchaeia archaeon]
MLVQKKNKIEQVIERCPFCEYNKVSEERIVLKEVIDHSVDKTVVRKNEDSDDPEEFERIKELKKERREMNKDMGWGDIY